MARIGTGTPENQARHLRERSASLSAFLVPLAGAAKTRARTRGLEYAISRDHLLDLWVLQDGKCALTGDDMTWIVGQGRVRTNVSVDRVDPTIGYIPGNVQLLCDYVNIAKSNLSNDEFRVLCQKVVA